MARREGRAAQRTSRLLSCGPQRTSIDLYLLAGITALASAGAVVGVIGLPKRLDRYDCQNSATK
jgi:hypothetical protein